MKNVLDTFFEIVEVLKSQSAIGEPLKRYDHPLNRYDHALKRFDHPYRHFSHPLNRINNPRRGIQRAEVLVELLTEYVLLKKMPKKQSSSHASAIAARALAGGAITQQELKTLAASVLSQDEIRGQKRG